MAITLAASLLAILLLAGAAQLLRLGHGARIDEAEAVAAAEGALAGFEATEVVVADDGAGALVMGGDGRLALVKRHGARGAVREVRWPAIRATVAGVEVETGERRFGTVTLAGIDALDLRRLAGEMTLPLFGTTRVRPPAG